MASPIRISLAQRMIVLAVLVLCVPACGGSRQPCYTVRGELFALQGSERKPAAGATIVFHPTVAAGDVPLPTAHVDEDGKFELTTYVKGDGAPVGEYTITIEWVPPRPPPPYKPKQIGDRLNGKYANPDTSNIKFTVEKGKDNTVPTIELKLP